MAQMSTTTQQQQQWVLTYAAGHHLIQSRMQTVTAAVVHLMQKMQGIAAA
jgi:hypothetical protein